LRLEADELVVLLRVVDRHVERPRRLPARRGDGRYWLNGVPRPTA
jgi:hypothetical protein